MRGQLTRMYMRMAGQRHGAVITLREELDCHLPCISDSRGFGSPSTTMRPLNFRLDRVW
jgi:hypothetical protein